MQTIRRSCYGIDWDIDCTTNPSLLEIKIPDIDKRNTILDLAYSLGMCLLKEEWRSKYNSYFVYDFEPFCSDGFILYYYFDPSHRHADFFLWKLFEDVLPKMERLEQTPTTRYEDGLRKIKC